MNKRVLWVVVAIAAVVGAILFVLPMVQGIADEDTEFSNAPEFGSVVSVQNPRFVMPPRAGQLASLYFDITNRGEQSVHLVDVAVGAAQNTKMADVERPVPLEIATVRVDPGETQRFAPEEQYSVLSDYDGTVVPGAQVQVVLTFGNAETVSFSAPVLLDNPHAGADPTYD